MSYADRLREAKRWDPDEPHPFMDYSGACLVCGLRENDEFHNEEEYGSEWKPARRENGEPEGRRIEASYTCSECGFSSSDKKLVEHHSCDVQENGGFCEDYPCCGHEYGDCNGRKYGSDEAIKEQYYRLVDSGLSDEEIDMYYERMNY
jgi:hypothetical protein